MGEAAGPVPRQPEPQQLALLHQGGEKIIPRDWVEVGGAGRRRHAVRLSRLVARQGEVVVLPSLSGMAVTLWAGAGISAIVRIRRHTLIFAPVWISVKSETVPQNGTA
jgi:hypothetical protein